MGFSVIIPARYGSTRLPGKPLRAIGERPLIGHVIDRARESGAEAVVVATDDDRIAEVVERLGARAVLTDAAHRSGTDRIAEVVTREGWNDATVVVNLQGDEPFLPGDVIRRVAQDLEQHRTAAVSTVCVPLARAAELVDYHVVKVVIDRHRFALYFSRAPIPWDREAFPPLKHGVLPAGVYYRHVGLYAYRAGFLRRFVQWPAAELENIEMLEQLRVLWHGERVHVVCTEEDLGFGVDTEQDLLRAQGRLQPTSRGTGP